MTNDEIMRRAQTLFDDSAIENVCRDDWHSGADQEAVEAIALHIRDAIVKVLDDVNQKAQEMRDTFHLRPLWDDPYCNGADTAAEEIQDYLRTLKESYVNGQKVL